MLKRLVRKRNLHDQPGLSVICNLGHENDNVVVVFLKQGVYKRIHLAQFFLRILCHIVVDRTPQ